MELSNRQRIVSKLDKLSQVKSAAVFSHGRVSWDTSSLDQYAKTHPEIGSFRKEGNPSVSLRAVQVRSSTNNT